MKLLVLGMDATSPALVRRWAAEGKLPTIRGLMDRGLSGPVAGVEGFFIGSTWPTFYTGLGPAGHGVYRIEQLQSGTYSFFRPFDRADGIGGVPFWRVASDAGRRVAVLDVPLSRIEPGLNGVQTVEWGGHDSVFGFHTSPPELATEILAGIGPYPLPPDCNADRSSADDFDAFVTGLERAAALRADLTLRILARENWDLVVQVFTEAHCAGHQCWHLHDPTHPSHDPVVRARLGDPLERVYQAIDSAVARILERSGPAAVLLFSAHGMSSFRGASFLLREILRRLGVWVPRPPAPGHRDSVLSRAARRIATFLPASVRAVGRARRWAGPSGVRSINLDPERSRCFPVANGFPVTGIRLNLMGREPQGTLQPGPETDAFCATLARDLLAIVEAETGTPMVSRVIRTSEIHKGPRRDVLPDLLVEWNPSWPVGTLAHAGGRGATVRVTSPAIGRLEGANRWGRTGEHVPEGFFVLAAPGVPAGVHEPVRLVDLYPTICALLELPRPAGDGAVLPEVSAWTPWPA